MLMLNLLINSWVMRNEKCFKIFKYLNSQRWWMCLFLLAHSLTSPPAPANQQRPVPLFPGWEVHKILMVRSEGIYITLCSTVWKWTWEDKRNNGWGSRSMLVTGWLLFLMKHWGAPVFVVTERSSRWKWNNPGLLMWQQTPQVTQSPFTFTSYDSTHSRVTGRQEDVLTGIRFKTDNVINVYLAGSSSGSWCGAAKITTCLTSFLSRQRKCRCDKQQ